MLFATTSSINAGLSCEGDRWLVLEAVGEDEGGQDEENGQHGEGNTTRPALWHGEQQGERSQHQSDASRQKQRAQSVAVAQDAHLGIRGVGVPGEQVHLAPRDYLLLKQWNWANAII